MFVKNDQIHFIGIGGSGMSGLARIMLAKGFKVSGSDLSQSYVTERLIEEGAQIFYGHEASNVLSADKIIYSTAINTDNPEVVKGRELGLPFFHRAELLGWLMEQQKGIAIAGAHGKTTTSSMLSLLFEELNLDPTVVVGGTLYHLRGNAKLGQGEYLVAEADESDGSFLKLSPNIVLVTNIEDDHLDHYGSVEKIIDSFRQFVAKVPEDGFAVLCLDDVTVAQIAKEAPCRVVSYGFNQDADYYLANEELSGLTSKAQVYHKGTYLGELHLQVPGKHNLLNALGNLAIAIELGLPFSDVITGLAKYTGVTRRFQFLGEGQDIKVFDDYAHHPTEVKATLEAAQSSGLGRVVAIFQPHRFTRTKQLYKEFSESFDSADVLVLTEVYSAGEPEIPGVSSKLIYNSIENQDSKQVLYGRSLDEVFDLVKKELKPGDTVLTMGAGNVWTLGTRLVEELQKGAVIDGAMAESS